MVKVFKSLIGSEKVFESYDKFLKMWDTEYIEEDIQTTFGQTHCIITGKQSNPPLIFIHGVGDNSAIMWVLNIKELSKHFYCIAVDVLGGPGKSVPNNNFNKKTFRQHLWLNEIVDYYMLKNFNIAGISNGAAIAFNYTIRESDRVRKVVCMEGGMIIKPIRTMIKTLAILFPEILVPTRNNMIKIMNKLCSPNSEIFHKYPEIVDFLILLMKNHNHKAMFVHNMDKYNKEVAMKNRNKFYFLIGEYKINNKKEFINILTDGGFKYKIIKDAGHGINHEQPDITNNEIINFILH